MRFFCIGFTAMGGICLFFPDVLFSLVYPIYGVGLSMNSRTSAMCCNIRKTGCYHYTCRTSVVLDYGLKRPWSSLRNLSKRRPLEFLLP